MRACRSCSSCSSRRCRTPTSSCNVVLPYASGALVSRIHSEGEVLAEEHLGEGTQLSARVGPQLASELTAYAVA